MQAENARIQHAEAVKKGNVKQRDTWLNQKRDADYMVKVHAELKEEKRGEEESEE